MDFTLIHGFFADMGGFVLITSDLQDPIPLDSMQLLYLVQHEHVVYPKILTADINDKSKADGLARYGQTECTIRDEYIDKYRFLSVFQALWFSINLVARPILGLAITTLELTTGSFVIVMFGTSYFWLHKPSDILRPITLTSSSSIAQIRGQASIQSIYDQPPLLTNPTGRSE